MTSYVNSHQDVRFIIVLQFGKLKFFRDCPYVSNCYNVSRLFINDDIDEISRFKESLVGSVNVNTSSNQSNVRSSMVYSLHDEFLVQHHFTVIAEISEIREAKSVVVVGTIKCLNENGEWYYLGCQKYNRKVNVEYIIKDNPDAEGQVIEEEIMKCPSTRCKDDVTSAIPRFRIQVKVQDATGVVSLTMFDRDATHILKQTAKDMLETFEKDGDVEAYPDALKCLLEKKYAFRIDISKFNLDKNYEVYGVSKVTDDHIIISELEKNFNVEQAVDSDLIDVTMLESQSEDTSNMKDAISCTGDNATPLLTTEKSTATSPVVPEKKSRAAASHSGLKRNLVDVYDVDDVASRSTTKPPRTSMGEGYGTDNAPLLIPKIEK